MVTRKRFDPRSALPGSPFLTHITLREDRVQPDVHPFTVPWLLPSLNLQLSTPVTFLVGENGTGKSTLLEAIAWSVGFGAQGGNRDQSFAENADGHALGRALRLSWRQKVSGGFFLRAETFFNFATYLEDVGSPLAALMDLPSYGRADPRSLTVAQRVQIARTVGRAPKVMVKVSGGVRTLNGVGSHLAYIGRQDFEVETDMGERIH
jgi:hypothetical protein